MSGMLSPAFISISPGPSEMLFLGVIILILFGSKNVPKIARTLGRTIEEFRRAARDVSDEIMRADPELENEARLARLPEPDADELDEEDCGDDWMLPEEDEPEPPDNNPEPPGENPDGSEPRTP